MLVIGLCEEMRIRLVELDRAPEIPRLLDDNVD